MEYGSRPTHYTTAHGRCSRVTGYSSRIGLWKCWRLYDRVDSGTHRRSRDHLGGLPVTRSTCDSRNLFSCQFVLPQHSDVQRQKSCQRCVAREQSRYL